MRRSRISTHVPARDADESVPTYEHAVLKNQYGRTGMRRLIISTHVPARDADESVPTYEHAALKNQYARTGMRRLIISTHIPVRGGDEFERADESVRGYGHRALTGAISRAHQHHARQSVGLYLYQSMVGRVGPSCTVN
ncbi:hypothetical protein EVAR_24969_1 [Eumeta japonica]|uniref:Uncharacterized protein n=1 Tax=Eumeta variegata TaxID=151549 RepID=A0A4C1ZNN4_EUMVA|nr:hypothetical protein EVAR_24969_1 [Eumeta japonica]